MKRLDGDLSTATTLSGEDSSNSTSSGFRYNPRKLSGDQTSGDEISGDVDDTSSD